MNVFFCGEFMKEITKEMLKIYKPYSDLDWMNYKLVKKDLTFHHIKKRENGGEQIIENGALLMPIAHQYLHIIEYKDFDTYVSINKMFEIVNKQLSEPTKEQREIIEYLLSKFEENHSDDKNSKGKTLIKWQYKHRGL